MHPAAQNIHFLWRQMREIKGQYQSLLLHTILKHPKVIALLHSTLVMVACVFLFEDQSLQGFAGYYLLLYFPVELGRYLVEWVLLTLVER